MLWLCIGKADYKALRRAFMVHVIYPKNYFITRIISMQNIVSYGLFLFSKSPPEEQTSCRFPTGSFAVHIEEHFRSGDHLRCCTVLGLQEYIGHLTVINSTISDCPKLRLTSSSRPFSSSISSSHSQFAILASILKKRTLFGGPWDIVHLLAMHCGLWR